ncbi:MAG TPA: GAF domain-containing protein [Puia sp.]|nr:GAF domain-containing protein [Puia sp.]
MSTPSFPDKDVARLAFMLRLVDTLYSMPDAFAIEEAVCRMLAEFLRVEHACFVLIGPDRREINIHNEYIREKCASLARAWSAFQPRSLTVAIEREQPFILDDAVVSEMIDQQERDFYESNRIRSCMAFPVAKDKLTMSYIAFADSLPRHWTAPDISLVHETAKRTAAAIDRAGAADRQNTRNEEIRRKYEQQLADLHRLRIERERLIQLLNAQMERLNKVLRRVVETAATGSDAPSAPVLPV